MLQKLSMSILTLFSSQLGSKIKSFCIVVLVVKFSGNQDLSRGGGGLNVKILTGMLVLYFFGFEIWPNPIFLGWQIF